LNDADVLAESKKARTDVEPASGEEVETLVENNSTLRRSSSNG
jgi:hypothetical protein